MVELISKHVLQELDLVVMPYMEKEEKVVGAVAAVLAVVVAEAKGLWNAIFVACLDILHVSVLPC